MIFIKYCFQSFEIGNLIQFSRCTIKQKNCYLQLYFRRNGAQVSQIAISREYFNPHVCKLIINYTGTTLHCWHSYIYTALFNNIGFCSVLSKLTIHFSSQNCLPKFFFYCWFSIYMRSNLGAKQSMTTLNNPVYFSYNGYTHLDILFCS